MAEDPHHIRNGMGRGRGRGVESVLCACGSWRKHSLTDHT